MDNYIENFHINQKFNYPEEINFLIKEKQWDKLNDVITSCLENLQNVETSISPIEHLERIYSLKKAVKIIKTEISENFQSSQISKIPGSDSLQKNAVLLMTTLRALEIDDLILIYEEKCYDKDSTEALNVIRKLIHKLGPKGLIERFPYVWSLSLSSESNDIFEELLKLNVPINFISEGSLPLHTAILCQNKEAIVKLLNAGADPNQPLETPPIIEACLFQHKEMVKLLIKFGANLNVINKEGNTPLSLYINNPEIFEFLCKNGANPNHDLAQSYAVRKEAILFSEPTLLKKLFFTNEDLNVYEKHGGEFLFLAVNQKNDLLIHHLLDKKCDPNYQTTLETTLTLSIAKDDKALVQTLIEHGADPNLRTKEGNKSPLTIAIVNENIDIIKILIQKGADINFVSKANESLVLYLETKKALFNKEKYEELEKLLSKESDLISSAKIEELQQKFIEDKFRKLAAMSSEMGGCSTFFYKEKTETSVKSLELEGLPFGSYWMYNHIAKSLKDFIQSDQGKFLADHASVLIQAFENGAESTYSKKQLEAIQKGEPCVINTGFPGHAVSILFWKDKMVICNRGGAMTENAIKVFNVDNKLITEEILKNIFDVKSKNEGSYRNFVLDKLPKLLNGETSEELQQLEKICYLQPQRFGNCSWASAATSFYAMLILMLHEEFEITDTAETAFMAYASWLSFFQKDLLQGYLEHHINLGEKGIFNEDRGIINELFIKLWNYQKAKILKKEVIEPLENLYLKLLSQNYHEGFANFKKNYLEHSDIILPALENKN